MKTKIHYNWRSEGPETAAEAGANPELTGNQTLIASPLSLQSTSN